MLINGLTPKKAHAAKNATELTGLVLKALEQGKIYDEDFSQLVKDAAWNAALFTKGRDHWSRSQIHEAADAALEPYFASREPNPKPADENTPVYGYDPGMKEAILEGANAMFEQFIAQWEKSQAAKAVAIPRGDAEVKS